ncbi:MAG: aminotransferase A [Alicyclobacillus macrosporangiidus]|uniref:aminotransferase A n=1 Tax=Alicyclobacillus macrosporangiidus TaxID=392015 RepID=UPI0026E92C2B|nr:aminotransferase A [Alicyclobacillus macrosporangiidus]MCL6599683.1 aminotransferase A [Alicyclobacillus macrosporangiidus]
MEHLLNPRVKNIQISGIRRFYNLVSQYPGAISLTIGQPDFPTPEHVKEAAISAIHANHTSYTPNPGIPALRQAAARFMADRYDLHYNPDDEVLVTVGASHAIDIALRTLLTEGAEVVLPGPIYPGYDPVARICGGKVLFADTTRNGFKLTARLLEPYLTPRTRCVILPYPSNPTGCVLTRDELGELAELLRPRDLVVLSDEIYSELVFDGQHVSIAQFPGMREKTIVVNGLSKSHSMTGWRIGLLFAPANITRHMVKVLQYSAMCATSISQYAAVEALTQGADDARPMREEYRWRRDYVYDRLVAMGLEVTRPQGAFYIFPSIRRFGLTSLEFATRLLEEQRVAVVPGDAFSRFGEGYVRISYACSREDLKEGMDRLERFVHTLERRR